MMKIIDDNGIDVGIDDQGNEYRTGLLPGLPLAGAKSFADAFATMPRSEWKEVDLWVHDTNLWDQDGQNSCGGHGSVAAASGAYHLSGAKPQRFSPCYTYGNVIAQRREQDSGARLDELLTELTNHGLCPESLVGPRQIYRSRWSGASSIDGVASLRKAAEWFQVNNFDEMMTAHQLGFLCAFGCWFGSAIGTPTGGYSKPQRAQNGGHCIASGGTHKDANGRWWGRIKNSHQGSQLIYLSEDYMSASNIATFGGAWAIRVVNLPPEDEFKAPS